MIFVILVAVGLFAYNIYQLVQRDKDRKKVNKLRKAVNHKDGLLRNQAELVYSLDRQVGLRERTIDTLEEQINMMPKPKFYISKCRSGNQFRYNTVGLNHRVLTASERFKNKKDRDDTVKLYGGVKVVDNDGKVKLGRPKKK